MKRRARRITIGVAGLGAAVVAVLMVVPGPVRDHVEAWHFQLTRETKTIEPIPGGFGLRTYEYSTEKRLLHVAADQLGCPVVFDPQGMPPLKPVSFRGNYRELLEQRGYRVLEQRIPRRTYVVIRVADPIEQTAERPMPKMLFSYGRREEPADPPPARARSKPILLWDDGADREVRLPYRVYRADGASLGQGGTERP